MPALAAASSSEVTANPSVDACRARTGSSSTTVTAAPSAEPKRAHPRPTSPYPMTTTLIPATGAPTPRGSIRSRIVVQHD